MTTLVSQFTLKLTSFIFALQLSLTSCVMRTEPDQLLKEAKLLPASREVGIFWGDLVAEPVNLHELKSWGITDFYLTNKYIKVSAIANFAALVNKAGMRFHLWFEQGLHQDLVFEGTQDFGNELWLRNVPFGDPKYLTSPICREAQHNKAFLDVQNPEARKAFTSSILKYAEIKGVSSVTIDDHTAYAIGLGGSNLPCLDPKRYDELRNSLTSLINETSEVLSKTGFETEFVVAHNPADWANRTGLADWKNWNVSRKNIQTYVTAAIEREIKISTTQNVTSVTLYSARDEIIDIVKSVWQTKLGVILFKLPAAAAKKELSKLFRGLEKPPIPKALEIDPESCSADDTFFRLSEMISTCAKMESQNKIAFEMTTCMEISCRAIGGGNACSNLDSGEASLNSKFFCLSLLPAHSGKTRQELDALINIYKTKNF